VTLGKRAGKRATVHSEALVYQAGQQTSAVHPGDTIIFYANRRSSSRVGAFVVGGNFGGQAISSRSIWGRSMAEAMAKLVDLLMRRKARGVY